MLTVIDEYTRECLAIVVARRLTSDDVLQVLTDLFVERGPPAYIRSDHGAEFRADIVRAWLERIGVRTLFIERGSRWENGYNDLFNGKPRDELPDRKIFYSLREAEVLIERWRQHDNTVRPHNALDYRPPAPQAVLPRPAEPAYAALRHAQPGAPKHGPTLSSPMDPGSGSGHPAEGGQEPCLEGPRPPRRPIPWLTWPQAFGNRVPMLGCNAMRRAVRRRGSPPSARCPR